MAEAEVEKRSNSVRLWVVQEVVKVWLQEENNESAQEHLQAWAVLLTKVAMDERLPRVGSSGLLKQWLKASGDKVINAHPKICVSPSLDNIALVHKLKLRLEKPSSQDEFSQ